MRIFPSIFTRRPRLRWFLICCIVLVAGAASAHFWMESEDRKFVSYVNAGSSINSFLRMYGERMIGAVETQSVGGLVECYAEEYQSPGRGHWKLGQESEIDGVVHMSLSKHGNADFRSGQIEEELTGYTAGLKSVERVACKINLAEEIQSGESARITVKYVLDGVDAAGREMQDRFFFRWWLRSIDEGHWQIVRDQLFVDPEVSNTRVSSAVRGYERMNLGDAGIDYVHQRDPSLDPEAPGVQLKFAIIQHTFGGVSTVDYDGDGLTDILFLDGVRSRLYRHQGIGDNGSVRYEDVTAEAGLDGIDRAHCGLFADVDNDGDKDLFVSRYQSESRLYENQGGGRFEDRSSEWGLNFVAPSTSATLLDFDKDGYVDLYVAINGDAINEVPRIPFFARNGKPNRLFRNQNGSTFIDVTEEAGVGDVGWSLAVCAGDLNGDGWTDIGVANDFGRKSIYRNNGDGTFTERAKDAGTLDFSAGMGIAFGDVDNDGLVDIYTSNIYSNQRWLGEEAAIAQYSRNTFRSQWLFRDFGEFLAIFRMTGGNWRALGRMAGEGNSLFANNGDGTFREARESYTNRAGWGWAVALFDADNDSDLDIYAANGWITGTKQDDL